jgi:hypothetical protein
MKAELKRMRERAEKLEGETTKEEGA